MEMLEAQGQEPTIILAHFRTCLKMEIHKLRNRMSFPSMAAGDLWMRAKCSPGVLDHLACHGGTILESNSLNFVFELSQAHAPRTRGSNRTREAQKTRPCTVNVQPDVHSVAGAHSICVRLNLVQLTIRLHTYNHKLTKVVKTYFTCDIGCV